jgi:predicted hotdog family 3-hydroxylacyl-ACP dehydratase
MTMDRAWIESRIPHQGRMCLIDAVVEWSADRIVCSSSGHRAADHPLRAHGRLGIACGIELAAQTMAVHGAVLAEGNAIPTEDDATLAEGAAVRPRAGLLASVRAIRLWAARLDDVKSDLLCEAVRVMGDQDTALYEFELRSSASRLISGRATVLLEAGHLAPPGPAP